MINAVQAPVVTSTANKIYPLVMTLLSSSFVGLILASSSVLADATVLGNSFGIWTLKDLGYSHIAVPTTGQIERSPPVKYMLPSDAAQGPNSWYMVYLHFIIEFEKNGGEGVAYVNALTNDFAVIQARFETGVFSQGIIWDNLELVNGHSRGFTLEHTIEMHTANYLPISGVQPGENILTFQLKRDRDVKVKRLTILEDSGIIYTPLGPPKLEVKLAFPKGPLAVGDKFNLGVVLENKGLPAKDVNVRVTGTGSAFKTDPEGTQSFPSMSGQVRSNFRLEALSPGRHKIAIEASSENAGRKIAEIEAHIEPLIAGQPRSIILLWSGLFILLILGSLGSLGLWLAYRPR